MSVRGESLPAPEPAVVPVRADKLEQVERLNARRLAGRYLPHLLTALCVTLVGVPTVIQPFWPDQAIFSTIAKTISAGGFPYVDAWDQKPPAIYLIYAVAIHGPFSLMRNVRVFDLLWTAATVIAAVELGRRYWNTRAGVITGLAYGVTYVTISGWWQSAQPDSFIGLPLLLALLLYERAGATRGRYALVAAGVLLGFAFQLRFIMALLIPFFPLVELVRTPRGQRLRLWFDRMVWLGVGFAALQAVVLGYLAVGGALGEYIAATRFASGYTRLGGPWQGPEGPTLRDYLDAVRFSFLFWALGRLALTAPAIIGGFIGVFALREWRVRQLVLFVALAYVGISAQAKFFWYHFGYMLPFLALLSGWTWDRTIDRLASTRGRRAALAGTGVLAAGLLVCTPEILDNGWHQWQAFQRYATQPVTRPVYNAKFGGFPGSERMAAFVRENTRPGEYVYVWGYDPLIYLLSDRPSSSRFIYCLPMMSDWAPRSWQIGFMKELEARPPAYFIAQRNQGGPWITGHDIDPVDYIDRFPALQQWLEAGYQWEFETDGYVVYHRR